MLRNLVVLMTILCGKTLGASTPCPLNPSNWTQLGSMCYWYSGNTFKTWSNANTYCNGIGGNLAAIYNRSELSGIENVITSSMYTTWSGLSRNISGTWSFIDKTSVAYLYQLWAKGEPSNESGSCGAIRKSSDPSTDGLVVLGCQYTQPFLCSQKISTCPTQNLTKSTGSFNSPNYPNNYANNEYCVTYITAPSNYFITLSFDVWVVEARYDVALIFDGLYPGPNAILMANISVDPTNTTLSPYKNGFQTTSNIMTIVFISDYVINYRGWKASYQSSLKTDPIYQNGTSGTLISPNYPNNYPNDVEQYYYVTAPNDTQIMASFSYFDTEAIRDYLVIFDGPDKLSPVIGNFSGHNGLPDSVTTSGNSMTLYFYTDYSLVYKGFSLDWAIF